MPSIISDLVSTISGMLAYVPVLGLIIAAFGDDPYEAPLQLLSLQDGNLNEVLNSNEIQTMYNAIKGIGAGLVVTFFIIHMIHVMSEANVTFETMIKAMMSLVIIATISSNGAQIAGSILSLGESAYRQMDANYTDESVTLIRKQDATVMAAGMSNEMGLGAVGVALFIWLAQKLAGLGLIIAAGSRLIDLGWHAVMLPIGIANSFEGGANSGGMRFIKEFVSSALSVVMTYVIIVVGRALVVYAVSNSQADSKMAFLIIGLQLALVGAAIAAPVKMKTALGA
ncbi:hypothetical protein SAMN05216391_10977 [Lachnospiraceae bacterium KHCPX20]|nr:hypothetical protein SAMN05216391_10977 [Lachnospiraceae bacterium KHCPX20]